MAHLAGGGGLGTCRDQLASRHHNKRSHSELDEHLAALLQTVAVRTEGEPQHAPEQPACAKRFRVVEPQQRRARVHAARRSRTRAAPSLSAQSVPLNCVVDTQVAVAGNTAAAAVQPAAAAAAAAMSVPAASQSQRDAQSLAITLYAPRPSVMLPSGAPTSPAPKCFVLPKWKVGEVASAVSSDTQTTLSESWRPRLAQAPPSALVGAAPLLACLQGTELLQPPPPPPPPLPGPRAKPSRRSRLSARS